MTSQKVKQLTGEQREVLSNHEHNMYTAKLVNYTRNISRVNRRKIFDIYYEVTGNKVTEPINCNSCIVNVLKELYDIYHNPVMGEHHVTESGELIMPVNDTGELEHPFPVNDKADIGFNSKQDGKEKKQHKENKVR